VAFWVLRGEVVLVLPVVQAVEAVQGEPLVVEEAEVEAVAVVEAEEVVEPLLLLLLGEEVPLSLGCEGICEQRRFRVGSPWMQRKVSKEIHPTSITNTGSCCLGSINSSLT
jgi:hypothetical protein